MNTDIDALLKEAADRPCLYCHANYWDRKEHLEYCLVAQLAEALRGRVRELVIHVQTLEEALKGD